MGTHKHHVVPRHRGGTDDPTNIIKVTVEEHANLHLALYLEHGHYEDWIAFHAISGWWNKEDIIRERCRLGAMHPNVQSPEAKRKRALKCIGRKRKPLTEEQKRRVSEGTKKAMNTPEMKERCRQHAINQAQKRDARGRFVGNK